MHVDHSPDVWTSAARMAAAPDTDPGACEAEPDPQVTADINAAAASSSRPSRSSRLQVQKSRATAAR